MFSSPAKIPNIAGLKNLDSLFDGKQATTRATDLAEARGCTVNART